MQFELLAYAKLLILLGFHPNPIRTIVPTKKSLLSAKVREASCLLEQFMPLWYDQFDQVEFDKGGYADEEIVVLFFDTCCVFCFGCMSK